ncbi:MAG: PIG-L deacetylase family protein [Acidimicrobiia bacterium]
MPVRTLVFFHAHPDDEAIFTGGTIWQLARRGWRIVLVMATGGEWGEATEGFGHADLAAVRRQETTDAAAVLGIARVEFLGYHDSGLSGDPSHSCDNSLAWADEAEVATRLAGVLREEEAEALVTYDPEGIYGHPDHVVVHRAGRAAAEAAGVPIVYEATVDREYLHFVETHLVVKAKRATGELGLAATHLGMATVEITTAIDVRASLYVKRQAMAAHASQIPETASVLHLPPESFAAVYGYEWYTRRGPRGPLEDLPAT